MTTRKQYTKEFKLDAVRLVTENGYKRAEAARNLGINATMLGRWIKEYQADEAQAFRGNGQLTPEQDELRRLSELTGRTVNHSVFSKWRRGERTPPPEALRYMAQMAVATVLRAEGINTLTIPDDALDRIAIALTPPPRQ